MDIQVTVKNFGKIKEANINLKDLSVFAGTNSTAKSYVSRALYCMFDALSNPDVYYCLGLVSRFADDLSRITEEHAFQDAKIADFQGATANSILRDFLDKKQLLLKKT